jgi:sulfotransferase family protein
MAGQLRTGDADRAGASQSAASGPYRSTPEAFERDGRAPDFFVIGHQKCGTTALYYMLRDHPQIYLSEYKEPRFFAPELRPPLVQETRDRPQTLESYLALFADAGADQLIGDTSPQYIRSPTAAAQIAALQPDARIIAIVREPVSYLRSYHMEMVLNHVEPEKDFRTAIDIEGKRRREAADGSFLRPQFLYSDHVRYVEQLRRFEAHFSRAQMQLIVYDDFRRDNAATVRAVQRFIGVDDEGPLRPVRTEPNQEVRSLRLHKVRGAIGRAESDPASAGVLARTVSTITPRRLRRGALAGAVRRLAYSAPVPPDERFVHELRRRFKPEVIALSEYLDRDLVGLWGYEEID